MGLDDCGVDGARDRAGNRREQVPVCYRGHVAQISVPHVQLDRELVDHLERVVCVLHHGELRRGWICEREAIQVLDHPRGSVRGVVRVGVVVEAGQPKVLLQDEAPSLVHNDGAIQAEPHRVRVERVTIREVNVRPEPECVVEAVARNGPTFREDGKERRVAGPVVVHKALVHLLDDPPTRSRERDMGIEGVWFLGLIEDQRIARLDVARVRRARQGDIRSDSPDDHSDRDDGYDDLHGSRVPLTPLHRGFGRRTLWLIRRSCHGPPPNARLVASDITVPMCASPDGRPPAISRSGAPFTGGAVQ